MSHGPDAAENVAERGLELVVARARGATLDPSDAEWLEEQRRDGALVEAEASVLEKFVSLGDRRPQGGEMSDLAMLERVLDHAEAPPLTVVQEPPRASRSGWWFAGAAVAAGVLVTLGLRLYGDSSSSPPSDPGHVAAVAVTSGAPGDIATGADARATTTGAASPLEPVADREPDPTVADPSLAVGASMTLASAECVGWPGVRACATSNATTISRVEPSHELRISLRSGALRAELEDDARGLSIETSVGTMYTDVGAFAVELDTDAGGDALVVTVDEGVVTYTDWKGRRRRVTPAKALSRTRTAPMRPRDQGAAFEGEPDEPSLETEGVTELLRRAQDQLASGERIAATDSYALLLERFPGSREARVATVSLGRLRLAEGRASVALTLFERHLDDAGSSGGTLTMEARYGRIRALRALGREADEAIAIDEFLTHHGDSIYAARLRERRGALGSAAEQ